MCKLELVCHFISMNKIIFLILFSQNVVFDNRILSLVHSNIIIQFDGKQFFFVLFFQINSCVNINFDSELYFFYLASEAKTNKLIKIVYVPECGCDSGQAKC